MITSVRFPFAVPVVRLESHIEWKPGDRGVKEIRCEGAEWNATGGLDVGLRFLFDDGSTVAVIGPPGTVICVDPPNLEGRTFVQARVTATSSPSLQAEQKNAHGPTGSPPPARALPAPSSRKGR